MKNIVFILCGILFLSCRSQSNTDMPPLITADSLATHITQFSGKKVTVEGKIIHVCPVDGKKMKLSGRNRQIVKIILPDSSARFEHSLTGKTLQISGTVSETRISRAYIDSIEAAGLLLCHIDHNPCNDSVWIANMHKQGKAEQNLQRTVTNLRQIMTTQGRDYVSVIVLVADKIKEIKIENEKIQTSQQRNNPPYSFCQGCPLCGLCLRKG